MHNVKEVLKDQRVEEYHCWVDSKTVLYWIKGQGTWSQFVRNRTKTIQDKENLQNFQPLTTLVIREAVASPSKMGEFGFEDLSGLQDKWPDQPEVSRSPKSDKERVNLSLKSSS